MNIDYKGYEGTKLDIKDDTIIRKYFENINKDSFDFSLDVNKYDYDEVKAVSDNRKNIISWYKGFSGKSVLELNADFGQITSELIKTASKVVSVEPIKEKAEAIGKRLEIDPNNEKLTIKVCNPLKLNLKEKFDIVTLIGIDNENNNLEKYIEIAKKHLNDNGKILLAINNKFGLKYFSGIKEKQEEAYNELLGKTNMYATKFDVEKLLKGNGFKYKVFYPIPSYEFTNAIFTDEFLPNEELILSRDLFFFDDKKEIGRFPEREVLKEIVKKDKFLFKDVCNSYLFEISVNKEDKLSNVKFVSFGLLRKPPFRIKTIIGNGKVRKYANNNISVSHIERIKTNIELLEKAGIKTIDKYKEEKVGDEKIVFIENDFIENSKTLDREIIDLLKSGNKDDALDKIRKFKTDILDKFEVKTKNLNRNIFTANGVKVHGGKIKKLHFIEEGLIDLIFQNTFVIDGKFVPYDQEWLEVNTPVEYILFRCFRYMPELNEYFNINDLYKEFGMEEFIEEFVALDEKMQSLLRDEIFWDMHVKSIGNIEANKTNKEVVDELEDRIKDLEKLVYDKDVHINNLENIITNNKNEIASFQNQIAVISNSFSWKITKPIRFLAWMFNPFSHAKFIDRIMPPGGRRRQKYDEKLAKKLWNEKMASYAAFTDEEGVEYFKGIEHRERLLKERSLERKAKGEWSSYEYWMEKNDPTDEELEAQRNTKFKVNPKISIVIPLYNTPVDLFRELIFNLYRQTYPNWELCLADGSGEELTEIKNMCRDPRIKYKFLGKNLGISGNSNEGLKMATGDWVALLDHDDLLMVNALYEVVKVINENKNVRFIYTDEDKMKSIDEPRFDAHFKPDFAPDYLRGNNYICHLSVFKKEVMDKLEGFRDAYNGAQDLDIILRTTEIVEPNEIVHIPKVLYHWRIIETSTAGNPETKLYAYESGRKAIEDHIHRLGYSGKVERDPNMYGVYRVLYDIEGHPKANIIISEYNNKENLERCIKTIEDITEYKNYDINVLVNSDDETAKDYLQKIEKKNNIYIHRNIDKDLNIFEKLNIISERVKGDYLVFVNGNLEIKEPRWLTDFIGFTQRNNVGSISGRIFTKDDILYFGGRAVNYTGVVELNRGLNRSYYGYFAKECHIENYTANFYKYMCIRKEIFNKVGKFNTDYKEVSDVDLSLKLLDLNMNNVYMSYDYAISYDDTIAFDEDGVEVVNPNLGDRIKEELDIVEKRGIKYDRYYTQNFNQGSNKYLIRVDKIEE